MDTFEINKIVGAILVTAVVVTVIEFAGNYLAGAPVPSAPEAASTPAAPKAPAKPETPAAPITQAPQATPQASAPETKTLAARLQAASAADGKAYAKRCVICHDMKKGGPHKVGPNLWGVVGRAKGSAAGYKYSPGLKAKGGEWTYEDLDTYLTKPKDFVTKSKMVFRVKKPGDRANVIAYMRTLADQPKPLPGQ